MSVVYNKSLLKLRKVFYIFKRIFFSDLKGNSFNLLRKFRRKYCNAEDAEDAELDAINFCCAEYAQICAYKKTC